MPFGRKTFYRQTFGRHNIWLILPFGQMSFNHFFYKSWHVSFYYLNQLSVHQMSVDQMSVDQCSVNQMSFDQLYVDQMSFDQMSVDQKTLNSFFRMISNFKKSLSTSFNENSEKTRSN
jgi:hypothetical protein